LNLQETAKIMAVLKIAYPRYYANINMDEAKQTAKLWATMLADYSYELVSNAVKALIATNKFPPTIADVIEKIHLLTDEPEMSELQAWTYVHKAIRNSTYNSSEEFKKLPEEIQEVIRTPEQLRTWAALNEDEVNTVVSSNFQRSFRACRKQAKEYAAIPSNVKNALNAASPKVELLGETEDAKWQ
jgi:hypothetical protein